MFKDLAIKSRHGLMSGFPPLLLAADIMTIAAASGQRSRGIKQINCETTQTDKTARPNAVPVEQAVAVFELQGGTHIASPPAFQRRSIQTQASVSPITGLKPNATNGDEPQEFQGGCNTYPHTIFCFKKRTAPCS
jgi:hypothetical protein